MILRSACAALALLVLVPLTARADDVTEAAAAFESGNEHFERGMRLRGDRRRTELEAALTDYFESLSHVRSRNVLYNTALVLEQLERWDDAFNYWSEYLAVTGLSAEEAADGTTHRDAIRPRVAVLAVSTEPAGAEIWLDRRDLAARGHAPLELAVTPGEHTLYLVLRGYQESTLGATATTGSSTAVTATLTAEPVSVQVLAPDGVLTLDGETVTAGAMLAVAPGRHLLRLEVEGRPPVERRFEVPPGGAPMVIDLASAVAGVSTPVGDATLHVSASSPIRLDLDGIPRATGTELETPIPPGDHEVRITPASGPSASTRRRFVGGEDLTLRVESLGTSGGLTAARATLASLATISLLAAAGLSIGAYQAGVDYGNAPSPAGADAQDAWNLAADVTWGASLALGVTAIIVLAVDDASTALSFEEAE